MKRTIEQEVEELRAFGELKPTDVCQNCHEHRATSNWVGEGGTLAFVHGAFQRWCECCCLKAQLEHAYARANQIPELERALAECRCEPSGR